MTGPGAYRGSIGGPGWRSAYPPVDFAAVAEQLLADVKTYAVTFELPADIMDTLRVDVVARDGLARRLTVALVTRVLGMSLEPARQAVTRVCEVDVPATWWQQWKAEHAASRWWGWLARRRPVVTRTLSKPVTLTTRWTDVAATYPRAAVKLAGVAGPITFMATATNDVEAGPWAAGPAGGEAHHG